MNAGKTGEGRPEPSPQDNGTGELSVEEIEKRIRIAQMEERLRKELERIQREREELEKKAESAKETIFAEMQQRYSLTEEEFRDAFRDIAHKEEIEQKIMEIIRERGENACKEKTFKECAEKIKKIAVIEGMSNDDIKKISIYIEEVRRYIEEKQIEQGKQQLSHKGRMHEQTIKIMEMIKNEGGRMNEKECLERAKEELKINTDTFNKRRYSLFIRGYVERDGPDLVLTPLGYARLQEEGY